MTANIPDQFASAALAAGCHFDQMLNFNRAGVVLQPRQLAASAAARLCDRPAGHLPPSGRHRPYQWLGRYP